MTLDTYHHLTYLKLTFSSGFDRCQLTYVTSGKVNNPLASFAEVSTHTLTTPAEWQGNGLSEVLIKRNEKLPAKYSLQIRLDKEDYRRITVSTGDVEHETRQLPVAEYTVMDIPPELVQILCRVSLDTNGLFDLKSSTYASGYPLDTFNDTFYLSSVDKEQLHHDVRKLYVKYQACQEKVELKTRLYEAIYELFQSFTDDDKRKQFYNATLKVQYWLDTVECPSIDRNTVKEKELYVQEIFELMHEAS